MRTTTSKHIHMLDSMLGARIKRWQCAVHDARGTTSVAVRLPCFDFNSDSDSGGVAPEFASSLSNVSLSYKLLVVELLGSMLGSQKASHVWFSNQGAKC